MKKKLLIAVVILIAIPTLLVAAALIFIDPIVRAGVEKGASSALKVPVHLERASIKLAGHATLGRLDVANPPGYAEPRALVVDRTEATVQPATLLKPVVRIDELTLAHPQVALEFKGSKSNLSALLDNLPKGEAPRSDQAEGKKFLIRHLRIENAVVAFRSDLISDKLRTLTLPTLDLENIGNAEGGATMGEILRTVLQALAGEALAAGEGVLPSEVLDRLRSDFRDLPNRSLERLRKKMDDLKSQKPEPADVEKKLKNYFEKKTTR